MFAPARPRMLPPIDAGRLDRRVIIISPTYNLSGDEITGWATVATVWASVSPAAKSEISQAARVVSVTEVYIVMRYRPGIKPAWRVLDGSRTYEIKGMADVERRGVQLQMLCEEIV